MAEETKTLNPTEETAKEPESKAEEQETTKAPANKSEKKEIKKEPAVKISKAVDAKLDVIKKNIDYCNDAGTPEALAEGGKYYKAFRNLIDSTVLIELNELKEKLVNTLPFSTKDKEMPGILHKALLESRAKLTALTGSMDIEGIKRELFDCEKKYADKYVEHQALRMNI